MKNKFLLITVALLVLFACNPGTDAKKVGNMKEEGPPENERVELAQFIINEVILNDTVPVRVSTSGFTKDGTWFPTETSFGYNNPYTPMNSDQVKILFQSLRKSLTLKIYRNLDSLPLSKEETFMFLHGCDSIVDLDEKGNAIGHAYLVCDSTSMYSDVRKILFYESWHLNKNSGLIEKTVLGYAFLSYIESKNKYNLSYYIFTDDVSLATVKKYLSIRVKDVSKR